MSDRRAAVEQAFPELDRVGSAALRDGVLAAWGSAMAEVGREDLEGVPWVPPTGPDPGDVTLVEHVRDVTAGAIALAEALVERRGTAVDADLLVAGALVHDVSTLAEYDGTAETKVGDLLGHPHYGVHIVARAGLPVEVAHVVLAHSDRTAVAPATVEAELVRLADRAAAAAVRAPTLEDLRNP